MTTKLQELREVKGWTQADLAEHSGLSHKTIREIESGKRKTIYIDTLRKSARSLDIPIGKLALRY